MDPVLVSAALGDGRDPNALLNGGVGEALAILAEAGEQSRSEHRTSAREQCEEAEVWEGVAAFGDVGIEASDTGRQCAKLRQQCGDNSECGLDDRGVGGQ